MGHAENARFSQRALMCFARAHEIGRKRCTSIRGNLDASHTHSHCQQCSCRWSRELKYICSPNDGSICDDEHGSIAVIHNRTHENIALHCSQCRIPWNEKTKEIHTTMKLKWKRNVYCVQCLARYIRLIRPTDDVFYFSLSLAFSPRSNHKLFDFNFICN